MTPEEEMHCRILAWCVFISAACIAAVFVLAGLFSSCTETNRTILVPGPPTLEELAGDYAVEWHSDSGSLVTAAGVIEGDTIAFEFFPCQALTGDASIGGVFEYTAGYFTAELKTLGVNSIRLAVEMEAREGALAGLYEARFNGVLCDLGSVQMWRTP